MNQSYDKRRIGIHVRLRQGLDDIISAVTKLNINVAQSFLLNEDGSYVTLSNKNINNFVSEKKDLGFLYFVHAAYWSSLVQVKSKGFRSLCREAEYSVRLQSQGLVVHTGATKLIVDKKDQVLYVAEGINQLLHEVEQCQILLENLPHAGRCFGGSIVDFGLLWQHIEQKDRVKICLDSAHAFVFGYNFLNSDSKDDFFKQLLEYDLNNHIGLLHINDTSQKCGSYIDRHEIPGTGKLGSDVLRWFLNHEYCKNSPIIMELPVLSETEKLKSIAYISSLDSPQ